MTGGPISVARGAVGIAVVCLLGLGGAVRADDGTAAEPGEVRSEIAGLEVRLLELLARLPPEERQRILQELADRAERLGTVAVGSDVAGSDVVGSDVAASDLAAAPDPAPPIAELPKEVPTVETPPAEIPKPEAATTPSNAASDAGSRRGEEGGVIERPSPTPVSDVPLDVSPDVPQRLPEEPAAEASPCLPFGPLDSNDDGRISAGDRYWRHLFVVETVGELTRDRLETLYEAGVRELDFARRSYSNRQKETEDIDLSDRVQLSFRRSGRLQLRTLVADAAALDRAGARLLAPTGEALDGYQELSAGMSVEVEGEVLDLFCAASPSPRP